MFLDRASKTFNHQKYVKKKGEYQGNKTEEGKSQNLLEKK